MYSMGTFGSAVYELVKRSQLLTTGWVCPRQDVRREKDFEVTDARKCCQAAENLRRGADDRQRVADFRSGLV